MRLFSSEELLTIVDILRLTLLDLPFMAEACMNLARLCYELSGPREVLVPWWWFGM